MSLKSSEVKKFKERLLELRQQITHTYEGTAKEVQRPDEATGYSQHQADQGTDDFDRTISLELSAKELDLLRSIDRALEKIDEGTYGTCDISGKQIPVKRLEAVPYANMTVEAQEMFEKGMIAGE